MHRGAVMILTGGGVLILCGSPSNAYITGVAGRPLILCRALISQGIPEGDIGRGFRAGVTPSTTENSKKDPFRHTADFA